MTSRLVLNSLKKSSNFGKFFSNNVTKIAFTQADFLSSLSYTRKCVDLKSHVFKRNHQRSIHMSHAFLSKKIKI